MTESNTLEECVKSALEAVAGELRGKDAGDKKWTYEIKRQLNVSMPRDCEACATGYGYRGKEFMYDFAWVKQGQDQDIGSVLDLLMVMECEWGKHYGIFDFRKLLVARADLRVMIFPGNDEWHTKFIEQMKREIEGFKKTQAGDRYLFACWNLSSDPSQQKFNYEPYVRKTTP